MQINWMCCAGSINFANGVHSTRNVSVWFVAKSLLASRSKSPAEHEAMERYGLVVLRSVATQFRWIGFCLRMKFSPRWRGWRRKNAKLRHRGQPVVAMED